MSSNILISICVPTYNGSQYLSKTLSSIAPFLLRNMELIISDDRSTDSSVAIAEEYVQKFHNVRLYQNETNQGMDGNFIQSVRLSKGKYIWFCGQDDIIGKEAITAVKEILESNNLIALNCNFSQYNHDYSSCNFESFFDIASFDNYKKLKLSKFLLFKSPDEYFSVFTQPPSFLPSVIIKRNLFLNSNPEKYNGTHFVQVGIFLEKMHTGTIGALTTPLVKGRVPNDGWQKNGEKLIKIMSGDISAKKIAFSINDRLPKKIINRDMMKFAMNYPFLLANAYNYGLMRNKLDAKKIESIFSENIFLFAIIKTANFIPPKLLKIIARCVTPIKRIILNFKFVKGLKG